MMYMTEDWTYAYCEALNKNSAYVAAAKKWEGDFVFYVYDDKTKELIHKLYFDLWHGECRKAKYCALDGDDKAEFMMHGPEKNWILVGKAKLDPIQGLMTGKFKLKGKKGGMAIIMRFTKAAAEMVNTISQINTEFPY